MADEHCKRCGGRGVVEIPDLDFPFFLRTGLVVYGRRKVPCLACWEREEVKKVEAMAPWIEDPWDSDCVVKEVEDEEQS